MSVFIGHVRILALEDVDILELDNGAGGKLYLNWEDASEFRRARNQKQLNDLVTALQRVAVRRHLTWPEGE